MYVSAKAVARASRRVQIHQMHLRCPQADPVLSGGERRVEIDGFQRGIAFEEPHGATALNVHTGNDVDHAL